jgi:vacuolar-type H+-ATPase subunit H
MERQDGIQQLRQAEEEAQRRVEEARQREHIWCSFCLI